MNPGSSAETLWDPVPLYVSGSWLPVPPCLVGPGGFVVYTFLRSRVLSMVKVLILSLLSCKNEFPL